MLTDCACGHVALKRGWNIKTLKREKENQMERLPYTEILKTNINVTNIDFIRYKLCNLDHFPFACSFIKMSRNIQCETYVLIIHFKPNRDHRMF